MCLMCNNGNETFPLQPSPPTHTTILAWVVMYRILKNLREKNLKPVRLNAQQTPEREQ